MQIIIREYENKDVDQLKQLIKLCFEENYPIDIINSSRLRYAFSAFYKNKLVGVIFVWKSDFHPNCTYFRLLVNPFYNTKDVAENLLFKLEQPAFDSPFQTSIWEKNAGLRCFFEQKGFKTLRKTYMPKLEISNMKAFMPETTSAYGKLYVENISRYYV